jgi:hypothetical protein
METTRLTADLIAIDSVSPSLSAGGASAELAEQAAQPAS